MNWSVLKGLSVFVCGLALLGLAACGGGGGEPKPPPPKEEKEMRVIPGEGFNFTDILVAIEPNDSGYYRYAPGNPVGLLGSGVKLGNARSAATKFRFYWSPDATITRDDTELREVPVPALDDPHEGREYFAVDATAHIPSSSTSGQTYFLGGCIDPVPGETDTDDNCDEGPLPITLVDDPNAPSKTGSLSSVASCRTPHTKDFSTCRQSRGLSEASCPASAVFANRACPTTEGSALITSCDLRADARIVHYSRNPTSISRDAHIRVYREACERIGGTFQILHTGGNTGGNTGSRASLVFKIQDACNDSYRIDYRFFQYEGSRQTGSWPGGNRNYYTRTYGETLTHSLACTSGRSVCFGGKTGPRSWGVGFDGDPGCTACCYTCPSSGTVTTRVHRLTC